MKNSRIVSILGIVLLVTLLSTPGQPVLAQTAPTPVSATQPLVIYTAYPSQIIGFGETATLPLTLRAGTAQTANLEVKDLPQGWTASFHGGSEIVDAVYVDASNQAAVDLRLQPPADVKAGKYAMTIAASSEREKAELPISLTIQEKLPPRISMTVEGLPTKRGAPNTATDFSVTLKNEGDVDLVTALTATQPDNVQVKIQSAGQDVNEVQLPANQSQYLTIIATPLIRLDAGQYPFSIQATAGDASAKLDLTLEVVGEGNLSVSGPNGEVSGTAVAGQTSPLKIVLTNSGTGPVDGVQMSSSAPSGWSVSFDQQQIAQIPAGQSVNVTAQVKPPSNAIAGDYMVTISAQPVDGQAQSTDFRVTVRTSTVWGVAGIGLIALAVAVVGMAVSRFGRR